MVLRTVAQRHKGAEIGQPIGASGFQFGLGIFKYDYAGSV
ncbi:MAG: hypothetical protein ACI9EH_001660 [Planktomarina sp.]|jgi:hypothetical protein